MKLFDFAEAKFRFRWRLFTSKYGSALRERYLKEKKRSNVTEIVLN